ncbi:MAG: phosphatidylserine decarboxylase family protein [Bacteroidia bacterium]|nr:phosphatidylserine decarboxylase family protein [Bacteroidia bacterium]
MILKLHKEGKTTIPVSLIVISILLAGGFWVNTTLGYVLLLPALVLVFLVFNFFRNPDIKIVTDDSKILSPCDGKVVVIEEVEDNVYFNGKVIQVSIFMSPLNVHVNRNPVGGKVRLVKYFPGKYLMAFNPKSSSLNEQTYVVTANDRVTVAYKQIAGFLARRIRWYINENDTVTQGSEYGFIKYGSRIDILMPVSCKVQVKLGDTVKAGVSILASV